jgi:hypothetical protein
VDFGAAMIMPLPYLQQLVMDSISLAYSSFGHFTWKKVSQIDCLGLFIHIVDDFDSGPFGALEKQKPIFLMPLGQIGFYFSKKWKFFQNLRTLQKFKRYFVGSFKGIIIKHIAQYFEICSFSKCCNDYFIFLFFSHC